jgi:cytochrome P450
MTIVADSERGRLDPLAPGFLADPYEHYARAREHAPVQLHERGVYLVFRYDDVKTVLGDRALSSSEAHALDGPRNTRLKAAGATNDYLLRPSVSKLDPPAHGPVRRLLARPFTPKNVERYTDRAVELVDELMAGSWGSEIDLIERLAYPLPSRLVSEIFGLPMPEDPQQLRAWTIKGLNLLDPFLTTEQFIDYTAAQRDFNQYLRDVIAWKRNHLADDVLSELIEAGDAGEVIQPDQVAATIQTLVIAGLDTTVNQLGISLVALMRQRDQWDRLVADPALIPGAVEELLRFEPTAQFMIRTVPADYLVGDTVIPAGNHIVPFLGSANRDERRFGPTADRLDITRDNVRDQIAFGFGPHACLGSWLARLELRVALEALVARAPGLQLVDSEPRWGGTAFIRGLSELRLTLAQR